MLGLIATYRRMVVIQNILLSKCKLEWSYTFLYFGDVIAQNIFLYLYLIIFSVTENVIYISSQ